jgi:hypothetical protein
MTDKFQPIRDALDLLKGTDQVIRLLAAEAIMTSVINEIDEDDLTGDMLDHAMHDLAMAIERI